MNIFHNLFSKGKPKEKPKEKHKTNQKNCKQTRVSTEFDITSYVPTNHKNACICMIDIVNFSKWCNDKTPETIYSTMTAYNSFLSDLIEQYEDVDKIELVGDSVLIMGGFRNTFDIHKNVLNIVHLAISILCDREKIKEIFDGTTSVRIGIHTGDIYSGFIENPRKFQLFGNSINIASRLESYSLPGTFSISSTTFKHLKSDDISTCIKQVIGKPKMSVLKGVGAIDCMMGFLNMNKILIADDDNFHLQIFNKMCSKIYELECVQSNTIHQTFKLMKENTYTACILDVHFIDTCVLSTLQEFRNWETIYRNKRQKVILTTSDIDNAIRNLYANLVDGYINKNNIYEYESYPPL